MATIRKFTKNDPKVRLNITLPESVRMQLEEYSLYYKTAYGDECERSELIEQLMVGWFDQDKDFLKFRDAMSTAQKAEVKRAVAVQARTPVTV
jgi:hypothetical protein